MSVADAARPELEELDARIERWIQILQTEDVDFRGLIKAAEDYALGFNDELPPALGAEALAEIRDVMIGGLKTAREVETQMQDDGQDRTADLLDDFVIRAESIRQIIRDALDENLGVDSGDSRQLARLLVAALPGVPRGDVADLLGVDVRTLQRWLREGEPIRSNHRVRLVAQLVQIIKTGWTPAGVVAWFHRKRRELGGRPPAALLDDPGNERTLLRLARGGKAQHAT
jgi:hypothetical protein